MIPAEAWADVWSWRAPLDESTTLDIEVVRGRIRIERAARQDVQIEAVVSDPAITMHITQADGRVQVRDFYSVPPAWFPMHECLPPPGEHGGFAAHASAEVELIVRVPSGIVVQSKVLAE
jgi:hypothetical protein